MRYVMNTWVREGGDADWDALEPEERGVIVDAHRAWFAKHAAAGHIVGGEEMAAQGSTRTIRRRKAGETVITDGPFIETKETLGGFVILEAASIEEALAIAETWPGLPDWSAAVEVRPTSATTG